ncbi:PilZ domain-containing protein [Deefgea tanakiae]|uniref:PilZ domain-containing protein n=1 Tax=Deefgea tanakiae TaxID=2865840 RepID=A0ABX8ZDE0_9NEIS|nr:PilZ domain-containing protein [Deefgea tanakiae]QZA79155.1 PilZ domain-containing protein [Deefgea tanakiae]
MSIPKIDGPSLFRDAIPLAWLIDTAPANDWEMSRYLQVLADFEQAHDFIEDAHHQQNAKSDLMLLWLARSLNTQLPSQTAAALGLEFVIWTAPHALPVAETGVVAFCLSDQFPFLLKISAKVISCAEIEGGFEIKAAWLAMSASLQDSYEKTIFRYHRRHIHQLRERKE